MQFPKPHIVPIRKEQLPILVELAKNTFCETYAQFNDQNNFEKYISNAFSFQEIEKQFKNPNSQFYFVTVSNEIAGYFKINYGSAQSDSVHPNGVEIEKIYVVEKYKRHGLGQAMVEKTKSICDQLEKPYLWLGVWKENIKAIQFYKKMGFEKVGTHIFQLGSESQIDYVMALDLK